MSYSCCHGRVWTNQARRSRTNSPDVPIEPVGQRTCQQYVLTEPFWLPVRVNIASISDSCCQSSFVPACQCNLAQPWVLFWHGFSAKPLAMISVRFSTYGPIVYCVNLYWVDEMDNTKINKLHSHVKVDWNSTDYTWPPGLLGGCCRDKICVEHYPTGSSWG